ncbi:RidA family protein [Oceanospirillum sediminis]|uniref:RidA family protein n=1 Tax=Oceanospirillum sediminis TaxID=2760088 RepID=A0A839IWA8_9GAMM|nr:RidA family protein [Oceanospirillum sediminis]MBB1488376.1 RidA family protein [Oceanospirillum sediminis]
MSNKAVIHTDNAPAAIGTYSQAVKAGNTVYMSGQIPLNPETMELVDGGFEAQAEQVFKNISAVVKASGAEMSDIVKLNIYLTDLSNFAVVNDVMSRYFSQPYPARAAVGISELPKGSLIEIEGVVVLS